MLLVTDFYYIHRVAILFMTFYCFLALFRVFLSHMCRQGNALADALAKRVRLSSPLLVWMESVPPDLYNCYLSDFRLLIKVAFLAGFSKKKKNDIFKSHKSIIQREKSSLNIDISNF